MPVSLNIRDVFSYFHDLNLLVLVQDLRDNRAARTAWFSGSLLCPVAHGLPAGQQVSELSALGQSASMGVGCDYAGRHLGDHPEVIARFVRAWDEGQIRDAWLLQQLEELWLERQADAEIMQELLLDMPYTGETNQLQKAQHCGLVS